MQTHKWRKQHDPSRTELEARDITKTKTRPLRHHPKNNKKYTINAIQTNPNQFKPSKKEKAKTAPSALSTVHNHTGTHMHGDRGEGGALAYRVRPSPLSVTANE